ncbi:MAG: hypothetical protein WAM82_31200 [Thermoanaerobaculia bacterium]
MQRLDEPPRLDLDAEIPLHVEAFIKASNLVRYSVITVVVASILLFVGYHNSDSESWFNSRLSLAYTALHDKVWLHKPGELHGRQELAREWVQRRHFKTPEEIQDHIKTLEEARTNHLLLLEGPFFGIVHDINDLGFFGSIALTVLMLMLTFAMSRQHENLYLTLWRVRRVWIAEGRPESATSHANLIYHTLAMSQQFSQPPTLARWQPGIARNGSKLLLLTPLMVQFFCLYRDWMTRDSGLILNSQATYLSLWIQGIALLLVLLLALSCYLYSRSNDKRWKDTFFRINRSMEEQPQPSWLEWVQWTKAKRKYVDFHHFPEEESPAPPSAPPRIT